MKPLSILIVLLASTLLFGESHIWKACGDNKQEALLNLSSTISANVQNSFSQTTASTRDKHSENINEKINYILNISSDMILVNQTFYKEAEQICVSVDKKDQVQNTQLLLKNVMLLKKENLPQDSNQKILKVQEYLLQIKQVNNLILAFFKPQTLDDESFENLETTLVNLKAKEKLFADIHTDEILKANALIFKSCEDTKESAYASLNKQLFQSKTKKKDDEGFLDRASSFFSNLNPFSKKEEKMLDLFSKEVTFIQDGKKECALIEKAELLDVATQLNQNISRFSLNSLSQNPKERYTQIKDYQEHLNVTKALIELFSENFSKTDFNTITKTKMDLANELLLTHPQAVIFKINGEAEDVKIKLNDIYIEKNTHHYTKEGLYTYEISTKDKCPIRGSFNLVLLKDKTIDADFTSMNYPLVNFYTKEETRIIIDGKTIQPNVEHTFDKCEGEVRYVASFANQSKEDSIKLSVNMTKTIELKFLTAEELNIFNDAKTKTFNTTTKTAFSDTLTPASSKNLEFIVEESSSYGKLELHERGSFTYTSKADFVGIDSFKYIIKANGEKSAPKVVNIRVNISNAPVAAVVPVQEPIKEDQVLVKEKLSEDDEKFQRFKIFVDSQEQDIEKLQKLQKKYPDMFERLLKEKLSAE